MRVNKIMVAWAAFSLFTLYGCTMPANVYIRNLSANTHILTVEYLHEDSAKKPVYIPDTPEISFNLYKNFKNELSVEKKGNTYQYTIPPHSTLLVEQFAPNLHSLTYRSVKLDDKLIADNTGSYHESSMPLQHKLRFGGQYAWVDITD